MRFYAGLPNKKNRIPPMSGMHVQSGVPIQLIKSIKEKSVSVGTIHDADESRWIDFLHGNDRGTLIFSTGHPPSPYVLSRFLGKVGLEALAYRLRDTPGGMDEVINNPGLDELRSYVRFGNRKIIWPYSCRSLYKPNHIFVDDPGSYEVLHEFDILITPSQEYYFVIAIFGEEYSINLGGAEIDGYMRWLEENNNVSPLYFGGNMR
jgi:hypothetical protein